MFQFPFSENHDLFLKSDHSIVWKLEFKLDGCGWLMTFLMNCYLSSLKLQRIKALVSTYKAQLLKVRRKRWTMKSIRGNDTSRFRKEVSSSAAEGRVGVLAVWQVAGTDGECQQHGTERRLQSLQRCDRCGSSSYFSFPSFFSSLATLVLWETV